MTSDAVASTTEQTLLGEGARWDARRDELLVVDILAGRVYRGRVADDGGLSLVRAYQLPGTVGAVAPVQDDQGWCWPPHGASPICPRRARCARWLKSPRPGRG